VAQDLVTLYNLALDTAGINKRVSEPSEKSLEAEACERWYPFIRDAILRAAFWPDAKTTKYMTVESERVDGNAWIEGDPEPGWRFAYKQPADCLYPRFLADYRKFSTGQNLSGERLVFCEGEKAILVYTRSLLQPEAFNSDLFMAMVAGLASKIGVPLHSKLSFVKFATEQADQIILNARLTSANEENVHFEVLANSLTERGYSGAVDTISYMHPYGPLISTLGGASVN